MKLLLEQYPWYGAERQGPPELRGHHIPSTLHGPKANPEESGSGRGGFLGKGQSWGRGPCPGGEPVNSLV